MGQKTDDGGGSFSLFPPRLPIIDRRVSGLFLRLSVLRLSFRLSDRAFHLKLEQAVEFNRVLHG